MLRLRKLELINMTLNFFLFLMMKWSKNHLVNIFTKDKQLFYFFL